MKYLKITFLLITINLFANADFYNPSSTPVAPLDPPFKNQPLPDLSENANNSQQPQIATDSTGQYVYAIWFRGDGSDNTIQVAYSHNFGSSWQDPSSTPSGSTPPNLIPSGSEAKDPQITCDSTAKYVYAIWYRGPIFDSKIQVAISDTFGETWRAPSQTPIGTDTQDLSNIGLLAKTPQITCDSTGKYVYAIWYLDDSFNNNIQIAISSDSGDTWQIPTSTPAGSPNMSTNGKNPQITCDSTGKNVYAIWESFASPKKVEFSTSIDNGDHWSLVYILTSDGQNPQITIDSTGKYIYVIWETLSSPNIIQIAISDDSGSTWKTPSSTPVAPPQSLSDLSSNSHNSNFPQISTDSTGKYVYAIWYKEELGNMTIQVSISESYGDIWTNPSTTPVGTNIPDLTLPAISGLPQIKTSSSGKYVYAIWNTTTASNLQVQIGLSNDFGDTWINPF